MGYMLGTQMSLDDIRKLKVGDVFVEFDSYSGKIDVKLTSQIQENENEIVFEGENVATQEHIDYSLLTDSKLNHYNPKLYTIDQVF